MVWCLSFLIVQNKLFIGIKSVLLSFELNLLSHSAMVYSNLVFSLEGRGTVSDQTIAP